MSRSKHRPFRDLASRVVLPKRDDETDSFATGAGKNVQRLGPTPTRVAPSRPLDTPPRREPDFEVEHQDELVRAWRVSGEPPPEGLEPPPSSTLDLHGLDEVAARRAVQRFVVSRAQRGDEHILVVVGKGRRSPGGHGVLGLAVVHWLTQRPCSQHVAAFRTASETRGGSGAIWIRLVTCK